MKTRWYESGLRFSCTQCGNCCRGEPGNVWVTPEEIGAIAKLLAQPIDEVRDFYTRSIGQRRSLRERGNGDCIFWDESKGCTIYVQRPMQCRTWPFWRSNVQSQDDWEFAGQDCPGMNNGEHFDADEIDRRVSLIVL